MIVDFEGSPSIRFPREWSQSLGLRHVLLMQVSISAFGSTGDIPQEHQPFFIREELGTLIKQKMTEDNSSTKKKKNNN